MSTDASDSPPAPSSPNEEETSPSSPSDPASNEDGPLRNAYAALAAMLDGDKTEGAE